MNAYIVEAVRTAGGRRAGKLADWHPADMAGEVLNALVDRCGIDPGAIEDVIFGCGARLVSRASILGVTPSLHPGYPIAFRPFQSTGSAAHPSRLSISQRRPSCRARKTS
jgi:acetyl-CoA acetyltransferase